jgi:hypothetical protein
MSKSFFFYQNRALSLNSKAMCMKVRLAAAYVFLSPSRIIPHFNPVKEEKEKKGNVPDPLILTRYPHPLSRPVIVKKSNRDAGFTS